MLVVRFLVLFVFYQCHCCVLLVDIFTVEYLLNLYMHNYVHVCVYTGAIRRKNLLFLIEQILRTAFILQALVYMVTIILNTQCNMCTPLCELAIAHLVILVQRSWRCIPLNGPSPILSPYAMVNSKIDK